MHLAFSPESLTFARVALFLALAAALAYALVIPLMRLNRRRTAGRAEVVFPQFQERLLTYVERSQSADPMLELLAADTNSVAKQTQPERRRSAEVDFCFRHRRGRGRGDPVVADSGRSRLPGLRREPAVGGHAQVRRGRVVLRHPGESRQ